MAEVARQELDALLDRQTQAWREGTRPAIEVLLAGTALRADPDAQLDLIYNEIVLREELGEVIAIADYKERFPHLHTALALHFEVHAAMSDSILSATAAVAVGETLREAPTLPTVAPATEADYEVLEVLGRGGMGVVYKARHRRLRRHVALKTFAPGRVPLPREVSRFRAEAEAVARLQHPNVVQIFEIGDRDGLPFLALELADGGTLAHRLQRLPYAPRAAAALIATLARAIHHAHEHGVIHRDLKPANVLFAGDGTPKITDFGLAKLLTADDDDLTRDVTRVGDPIGTPRYMAPEQATGRNNLVGPATDVYGLGNLLYECLTGQVPFVAAGFLETLHLIRTADPRSPKALQPSVPRDLETICLTCLHKEPALRYRTALALADDLDRYLAGEPIAARPTPIWERGWKWCRRRPTVSTAIAFIMLLLLTGGLTVVVTDHQRQQQLIADRAQVEQYILDGQAALDRHQPDDAETNFQKAWELVESRAALHEYRFGVAALLGHAQRAGKGRTSKLRHEPRQFDELRDEAFLLGLLLDVPSGDPVSIAREAIAYATSFTLIEGPVWQKERERLALIESAMLAKTAGPGPALVRLTKDRLQSSRLIHVHRARYLEQLGRSGEAAEERRWAATFPADPLEDRFWAGYDRLRDRDFVAAERELEIVLDNEPEHFTARLFTAICVLHQHRPAEAKPALTACLAQRPRFVWSYLFRAQCARAMNDLATAKRDLLRGLDLNPPFAVHHALLVELGSVHQQLNELEAAKTVLEEAKSILAHDRAGQ